MELYKYIFFGCENPDLFGLSTRHMDIIGLIDSMMCQRVDEKADHNMHYHLNY